VTSINALFDNLDAWRHLPSYQLERRADIFFSIYLPDLLHAYLGVQVEGLIPEFPLRIGAIDPQSPSNQSFKVDYLVKCSSQVVLFELKTDAGSRRDRQDQYLERAKQVGLAALLGGVRDIYRASASKRKYCHLLYSLQQLGFIVLHDSGAFTFAEVDYDLQIVYLQPHNLEHKENVISFQQAAQVIQRRGDPLSVRFAASLRKWAESRAGEG
jgi:hypothetical protein